jgi:pimeloyl-ACP methyl ester carboxylesterase
VAPGLPGHVVAVDLRGHGHTGWCGPSDSYHLPEYVADLDALVTALGGRAAVVGHSLGGAIVTTWAAARPDRATYCATVDGLGLPDGLPTVVARMTEFLDAAAAAPKAGRPMADAAAAAARLRATHPALDEAFALELAARGTRAVDGGVAWRWDPRHRWRSPTPYRADAHASLLSALRCPVRVVRPRRSPFAAIDVEMRIAACSAARTAWVEDAGHMVPLEAPEALVRILAADLAGARVA